MPHVGVLLYPGCIFLEIAPVTELLADHGCAVEYFTPDGAGHRASNGAAIAPAGSFADLAAAPPDAVVVPGGNPDAIIDPGTATPCLRAAHAHGALVAGICAGGLVIARAGLLQGRRATHNYTAEHAAPEVVACAAPIWDGIHFVRADVVVDGPFITAQYWAREKFAAAVAQALGALSREQAAAYLAKRRFSYDDGEDDAGGH